MKGKGPFYTGYLEKLYMVTFQALAAHSRTSAFRFDLQLPDPHYYVNYDRLIDRFIESLKTKIRYSRNKAKLKNLKAHLTDIRYVWACECNKRGEVHYHFVLFLNYDAINVLGTYEEGRQNLFSKIVEAWYSALDIKSDLESTKRLVHAADNGTYYLSASEPDSVDIFFERASYLAKVATKQGGSRHSFGGSRL